jgi:hypothetical protein
MTYAEDSQIAQQLSIDARDINKFLRRHFEQELEAYGKTLNVPPYLAIAIADKGNSVAQGNRGRGGKQFEAIVLSALGTALIGTGRTFIRGWNHPGWTKKPMDGFLSTEKINWYASIKRSARERGEHTWNAELAFARAHSRDTEKECRLLVFLEESPNEKLRAKLDHGIELICVHNHDAVRRVITEIRASVN